MGEVTCCENDVANVEGETAPRRHGFGDVDRDVPVPKRLGLGETDLGFPEVLSADLPRFGVRVTETEVAFVFPPRRFGLEEMDLGFAASKFVPSRFGLGDMGLGFPVSLLPLFGLKAVGRSVGFEFLLTETLSSIGSRTENSFGAISLLNCLETDFRTSEVRSDSGSEMSGTTSWSGAEDSCCGGVGARVGKNGKPDPKRGPEFGEGGGGPEYPDTLSGRGDKDRVPDLEPEVRVKPVFGGARSSFPQHLGDVTGSSFLEYLAELERTNPEPERIGEREGDRDTAGLLIRI